MYFAAAHIGVKLYQDYSDFTLDSLVICDGIGSLASSDLVAKKATESIINNRLNTISEINWDFKLKDGGSTIIFARETTGKSIFIEYLGNGGIIQLAGNFADNRNSDVIYRYTELMMPHVLPSGELYRFISSGDNDAVKPSTMTLSMNHREGNILLFFTDGISTLEERFVIEDSDKRLWRYESQALHLILSELNEFLKHNFEEDLFLDLLKSFIDSCLISLKNKNLLEDDAALGIIITAEVLEYYKSKKE